MNSNLPRHGCSVLKNRTCIYCGKDLPITEVTKEHVIGRKFVPKGELSDQWNLIAQCCVDCNNSKGELENDISAITIFTLAANSPNNSNLIAEALRKAEKCISRKTHNAVAKGQQRLTVNAQFGACKMSLNFIGPPEIENERIEDLCRYHVTGFFYWMTFDQENQVGSLLPGRFTLVQETFRPDWGNATHVAFMQTIVTWQAGVLILTANEHFKILIRQHPSNRLWAWALEWNKSSRCIGFFGDDADVNGIVESLPLRVFQNSISNGNETIRMSAEVPLEEAHDILFVQ